MLTVLSAGLPISAKDILTTAMDEVFDNAVTIQELTKENLRSRVRLGNKSVEVVLVILDGVSSDLCKDIEGGLYNSEKYYSYINDTELLQFLNSKYNLFLEIEEAVDEPISVVGDTLLDEGKENYYSDIIKIKEDTIYNLECRIRELTLLYGVIEDDAVGVSNNELGNLRDENILLNNKILELNSVSEYKSTKIAEVESLFSTLKDGKVELENRLKKVSKNYDEVVLEANELKVSYSKQSGVIRNKDVQILELERKQLKFLDVLEENKSLKEAISEYKSSIASKESEIGNLKVDIQSRDRETVRLLRELESLRDLESVNEKLQSSNATINSLKSELSSVSFDNDSLNKKVKENERVVTQLSDSHEEISGKLADVQRENEELNDRIKSDDESLFQLNKEKLDLQSKLFIMEKSVDADSNTDVLIREVQDLQNKVAVMSSNIFTNIGLSALPTGTVSAKVFNKGIKFNNVRFAFAGSAESRKGSYRCLLDEFSLCESDDRYLIVDLVSETSIDYVFQVKKTIPGLEWFRKGGGIQQYVSTTGLKNTQVLSVGIGYINDSYFLSIDWDKRLLELENSGYKVVLFCGDVSNLIGRVLHESFASHGESTIYIVGNAVGSRTLVTNLRGLSNKEDSMIAYYDFNPAMQRFYDLVSKSNKCKILSTRK